MRRNQTSDPDYLDWVRKQPCNNCGLVPLGTNCYGNPHRNAVHHVNGRHNDHSVVPACDRTVSGPGCKDCHHQVYHKDLRKWRKVLTNEAEVWYNKYKKEVEDAS